MEDREKWYSGSRSQIVVVEVRVFERALFERSLTMSLRRSGR